MKNKKGFTLIELIVLISIIGILVLLATPKFINYKQKAHLTEIKSNIKQLENASERHYIDNQEWPRLSESPYTAEQIEAFSAEIKDKTGQIATLDPSGSYYALDYSKLEKYVQKPKDGIHYILQNPVGEVFYLENITDIGKNALKQDKNSTNTKPVAVITINPNVNVNTETNISWSYLSSTDADGDDIINAEWDNALSKYETPGSYTVRLRVQDSKGLWSEWVTEVINVKASNNKPVAVITRNPSGTIITGTSINWSFSNSIDSDGDTITNVEWQGKQDIYSVAGEYIVKLRVQDSKGEWSDWIQEIIQIKAPWEKITLSKSGYIHKWIKEKDGGYIASGNYGYSGTSLNGVDWNFFQIPIGVLNQGIYDIYYEGSLMIAVGDNLGAGVVSTSNDNGATWTRKSYSEYRDIDNINKINGTLIATAASYGSTTDGLIIKSTDNGATWSIVQRITSGSITGFLKKSNSFMIFTTSTQPLESTNGLTWVTRSTNIGNMSSLRNFNIDNNTGYMVASEGANIYYSTNGGYTWTLTQVVDPIRSFYTYNVKIVNNTIIAVGEWNRIAVKSNFNSSWEIKTRTDSNFDVLKFIEAKGNIVVASGNKGHLYYSYDRGATWTKAPVLANVELSNAIIKDGKIISISSGNILIKQN